LKTILKGHHTMTLTAEQTVGRLVAENPARARIFEKHRIDYCCGGKISLSEACERRHADYDTVVAELAEVDAAGNDSANVDWTTAPLGDLADHIVATHHAYLAQELPRLEAMSARVAKVHGDHAPEVERHAWSIFLEFRQRVGGARHERGAGALPMDQAHGKSGEVPGPFDASVASPIRCMEHEHENAGAALERIRELTSNYQPPADACNTWRVLYASLDVLEQDMHVHVHKENSILFPRALALEESLQAGDARRVHL
jgi:regulator of cell morphogenesis and NO signaling